MEPLARERIGVLGKEEVGLLGICLVADLVTHAALEEVSTTSAPPSLDLPLLEGFGSFLCLG